MREISNYLKKTLQYYTHQCLGNSLEIRLDGYDVLVAVWLSDNCSDDADDGAEDAECDAVIISSLDYIDLYYD